MKSPDDLMVEIVTGSISDTAAKALDSEVSKELLGPAAAELGGFLGALGSVVRFYGEDNLHKIFRRWSVARGPKALDEASFKKVLPLLQPASVEFREELYEQWAQLLESATTADDNLISFANCLAQLQVSAAKYLNHLWSVSDKGKHFYERRALIEIYLDIAKFMVEGAEGREASAIPFVSGQDERNFETLLSDLLRLSLLEKAARPRDVRGQMTQVTMRVGGIPIGQQTIEVYGFSDYGKRFMNAITAAEATKASS